MPKEASNKEARQLAMTKIMNPMIASVELDIESDKIELLVTTYDGETQTFRWTE